jgi:hypothetical protein
MQTIYGKSPRAQHPIKPPVGSKSDLSPVLITDMDMNNIPSNAFTTVRGPYTRKSENGGGEILVLEQSGKVTNVDTNTGELTVANKAEFIVYNKEVHEAINKIIADKGYVILK